MSNETAKIPAVRTIETPSNTPATPQNSPIFPEFSPFFTPGELENASLTFYLRDKNSDKPTPIIARIKIGDESYRYNTSIKIHPALWDSKQHKCFELGDANEPQRRLISRLALSFGEILHYICLQRETPTKKEVRRKVANIFSSPRSTAGRKKNAPSTNVIRALHTQADKRIASTARTYHTTINRFEQFLKDTDTAPELHNVDYALMYRYRDYLTQQDNVSFGWAKECLGKAITMLKELGDNPTYEYEFDPRITTLKVTPHKDERNADDIQAKHLLITPQQVKALQALELPTLYQQQVRDLYLLQIFVGCRHSDLSQVIDRSKLVYISGKPLVKYLDRKEGSRKKKVKYCHAPLYLHPDALALWERLSTADIVVNLTDVNTYNQTLKKICKGCVAFQSKVTYKGARNEAVTKYQWQLCTSHAARHTFITRCGETLTPDEITFFTGHANADCIRATYLHYTDTVINGQLSAISAKFEAAQQPTQQPSTSDLLAQFASLTIEQQAQLLGTLSQCQV